MTQWKRIRLPMQETQEMRVWSLGQEDPLEKEMETHSSDSCLENPVDRGAWRAIVLGFADSWTRLSDRPALSLHFHIMNTT